jgi:hypothetical protein
MEYQQIKILLERYFQGDSSLEEEKMLRQYFSGPAIDERFLAYQPMFQLFAEEQKLEMDSDSAENMLKQLRATPVKRLSPLSKAVPWMLRVAAALVLVVGMWWAYNYRQETAQTAAVDWSKYEITNEKEALRLTKGAFMKASKTLNQGAQSAADQIDKMQDLGKFFK